MSGIGNYVLLAALPYYGYVISDLTLASAGTFISDTVAMILCSSVGGMFAGHVNIQPVGARL